MRVLICPDKFKASLSALEVCHAISEGVLTVCPDAEIGLLPIADGGEGTVEAFCTALHGELAPARVCDPLGREITASFGLLSDGEAVLELAAASGFRLVGPGEQNPARANTFGTGELLLAAAGRGAKRLIVGLGGSATNDAGVGMAVALGYQFLDAAGLPVEPVPAEFHRIASIRPPDKWSLPPVIALCDVTNPLTGPQGATYVYGPQKGVKEEELAGLDAALHHVATLAERDLGVAAKDLAGAGAAGGMGFGMVAFARAKLRRGFDVVAEVTELEARIEESDIIFTGEGRLDSQSIAGKGPFGVAEIARNTGKLVICIPGMAEQDPAVLGCFDRVLPLVAGSTTKEMALAEPARWLAERAAEAMRALRG